VPRWLVSLSYRGFICLLWVGAGLISVSSLEYFDPDTLPAFVREKLPLRFEELWRLALQVHVASGLVCFPLCLLLMTRWLQRRASLHRWLGRFSAVCILCALVPSGVVLAFEAKGGWVVGAGFLLSVLIVAFGVVYGVLAARRRAFVAHRRAVWHVTGQMSVAVTSRALLIGLDVAGVDPTHAYVLSLWLPLVATTLAVEFLVGTRPSFPVWRPASSVAAVVCLDATRRSSRP
jgi:hypothetical protein